MKLTKVKKSAIVHLKSWTIVVIWIHLNWLWGPKMDLGCLGIRKCILKDLWVHLQPFRLLDLFYRCKKYDFWKFSTLLLPKKNTKHFSNLFSNNAHLINAHIKIDTCHKFMLSPNNLKFKPIIILEKINHIYSKVEIKTLKKAKLCLVIKSQRFVKP